MREYIQKFSHAASGIKVYGCDNEEVHVLLDTKNPDHLLATLSDGKSHEVYEMKAHDLDELNQIIEDWFMVDVGCDIDMVSNTRFVANNGTICPACESSNITVLDIHDNIVKCNDCKSRWYEDIKITGYTMIVNEVKDGFNM
jgi:hypothetical protein